MGGLLSKSSRSNNNCPSNSHNKSIVIDCQQPGPSGYCKQLGTDSPTTTTTNVYSLYNTDDDDNDDDDDDDDDNDDDSKSGNNCERKLSIVSLTSSSRSSSRSKYHGESKDIDGGKLSLTDLSKLGAKCLELSSGVVDSSSSETEQERLFREEQERLEKENQQMRAKTARLKRRSELYGGSGARLSHGANGVKSAESVLRLIESNASGSDSLIPSSSSSIRVSSYVASSTTDTIQHSHHHLPAVLSDSLRKKASHSTIDNQLNKEPTFTPPPLVQPGSHRGVSRIRDNNDSETVSRSAQYMRNLNNRTIGMGAMNSQNSKKISPLVTQSDLNQRAVIHSPNQGIRGQVSSWRLVPLRPSVYHTITNSAMSNGCANEDGRSTPIPAASPPTKLPPCNSRNRAGLLLEGNLTMNKIERFLEARDHIDKTEFDVVVRNLVDQQITAPVGENRQQQFTDKSDDNTTVFLPEFQTHNQQQNQQIQRRKSKPSTTIKGTFNTNENRFVSAPYHPNQSRFYGKNKFFEPAAYAHFPKVSGPTKSAQKLKSGTGETSGDVRENKILENLKLSSGTNGSKCSLGSERSEKREFSSAPSPAVFTEDDPSSILSDSLMEAFNKNGQSGGAVPRTNKNQIKSQDSIHGLPPVSSVPLVTRSAYMSKGNGGRAFVDHDLPHLHSGHSDGIILEKCRHDEVKTRCRRCNRPPSRGGRLLMEWLQKKPNL